MTEMKHVFIIEGNVGAGKTTLAKKLYEEGYEVIEENWENDSEFLKKYYSSNQFSDVVMFGWCVQLWIMQRFILAMNKIKDSKNKVFIIDRGVFGSVSFLREGRSQGIYSPDSSETFINFISKLYKDIAITFNVKVEHIYLDCPGQIAYERVEHRYKKEEDTPGIMDLWGSEISTAITKDKLRTIYINDWQWIKKVRNKENISIKIFDTVHTNCTELVKNYIHQKINFIRD